MGTAMNCSVPGSRDFPGRLKALRALRDVKQITLARWVGVHEVTVSRWECGKSWPTLRQQVALCEALNVSVEELGLSAAPPRVMSNVQATKHPPLLPRAYTDNEYVQGLREHTRQIIELENRVGGAELSRVAARFFGSVRNQIASGTHRPTVERDLYAAAGELAEVTGWLFYDADEQELVHRMNHEALRLSRLAGDRQMELLTLQNVAMHAGFLGRPREALQIACSVLEGRDRLSSRLQAV